MKRFWQIITLVLLALMVPASVCCYVTPDACATCDCESIPDQHDECPAAPDMCSSDSIAHSKVPSATVLPGIPMLDLVEFLYSESRLNELAATIAAPVPLMTTAPPELRVTWVFVSRAALPARAPAVLA